MSKIFAQGMPDLWKLSGSMGASGSSESSTCPCGGYAKLVGIFISSASGAGAACGLRLLQSADGGINFDHATDYEITACAGSAIDVDIVGDIMKAQYINGADAVDEYRLLFQFRPI